MRRTYSRERYLGLVERIREAMPGIALTTDIIVGFPGETEADFADTLSLVDLVGFDHAFTFVYSARRGTEAARMPDQVTEDVRRERIERLVDRIQHHAAARNAQLVGTVQEVLVEGPSRTDPAILRGRTRGGKALNFTGTAASDRSPTSRSPARPRRRSRAARPLPSPPRPMAVIAIFGPTASGKSAVALELADLVGGEIVSCDAMQLYHGLPILTNQPPPADRERVAHHLVAVWEPSHEGSVAEYADLAHEAIDEYSTAAASPSCAAGAASTCGQPSRTCRSLPPGAGRRP